MKRRVDLTARPPGPRITRNVSKKRRDDVGIVPYNSIRTSRKTKGEHVIKLMTAAPTNRFRSFYQKPSHTANRREFIHDKSTSSRRIGIETPRRLNSPVTGLALDAAGTFPACQSKHLVRAHQVEIPFHAVL